MTTLEQIHKLEDAIIHIDKAWLAAGEVSTSYVTLKQLDWIQTSTQSLMMARSALRCAQENLVAFIETPLATETT